MKNDELIEGLLDGRLNEKERKELERRSAASQELADEVKDLQRVEQLLLRRADGILGSSGAMRDKVRERLRDELGFTAQKNDVSANVQQANKKKRRRIIFFFIVFLGLSSTIAWLTLGGSSGVVPSGSDTADNIDITRQTEADPVISEHTASEAIVVDATSQSEDGPSSDGQFDETATTAPAGEAEETDFADSEERSQQVLQSPPESRPEQPGNEAPQSLAADTPEGMQPQEREEIVGSVESSDALQQQLRKAIAGLERTFAAGGTAMDRAVAAQRIAAMYTRLQEAEQAAGYLQEAVDLAREAGLDAIEADALGHLALNRAELGLEGKATELLERCIAILQSTDSNELGRWQMELEKLRQR